MNVLVTGGSGYLGSVLVPKLLERGHKVRVVDAGYFGHNGLDAVRDKIELIDGDIREADKSWFSGMDAVIHLAAFSNDPTAEHSPLTNFAVNFDGTRKVADLAKEAGIKKFLYASTCSVYYTDKPDDKVNTESTSIFPKAPYSLSKHLSEQYLLNLADDNFAPVLIRKGTLFGQSPRMRYDLAIDTMTKNAWINKSIIVHSGGWMWRPFLNVHDAARAYVHLLEQPNEMVGGKIFNAISFNKLIKDIAEDIKSVVKKEFDVDVVIKDEKSGPQRSYRVSGDALASTGFVSEASFDNSVKETWETLASGKHDLGESKYYNIRQFEYLFPREI
ncbi:MAG: SDR family oxidoreductase [bacterium]|nr:SDR family oxidoreductase [bacterium]